MTETALAQWRRQDRFLGKLRLAVSVVRGRDQACSVARFNRHSDHFPENSSFDRRRQLANSTAPIRECEREIRSGDRLHEA